jgi:putative membrane protein
MLLNKRIPIIYIFNKVKVELAYVLLVSLVVLYFTTEFNYMLPEMPLTIAAFMGTAISILLSFKLNQSYDRWWEARKIWGSIVNDSRSFVMQLLTLTDGSNATIKKIAYRQIAWCYSLGQTLRGLNPIDKLEDFLSAEELNILQRHSNKPLALLRLHGKDLEQMKKENQLNTFTHLQLDNTLVRLCDAQGKAERIKSTVFPVTYRKFLHFFIYLFVVTLSVSLKDVAWYFEIPLLLLISAAFFLLERSATHMQDPFNNKPTDTAVTAIARTIEINIKELLEEEDIPKPLAPSEFYLS